MKPKTYPFTIWQINAIDFLDAFSGEYYNDEGKGEKIVLDNYYSFEDNADSFQWSRHKWENNDDEDVLYYSLKYEIK